MTLLDNQLKQFSEKVHDSFPAPRISAEFVKSHADELPLFSPSDFKKLLPAYLLLAVSDWSPGSQLCEFTIYGVSPDKDFLDSTFWSERYSLFNRKQVETVLSFLELVAADEAFSFIFSQVKRAPERILKIADNVAPERGKYLRHPLR